ncbi:hypothetical protein QP028_12940 [Corynebacterium suedekumii]|nr:hypothetical protein QP028_12940 [Corynebacterium suedekumii]
MTLGRFLDHRIDLRGQGDGPFPVGGGDQGEFGAFDTRGHQRQVAGGDDLRLGRALPDDAVELVELGGQGGQLAADPFLEFGGAVGGLAAVGGPEDAGGDVAETDVVAADGQCDQGGLRGQRVDLRRQRPGVGGPWAEDGLHDGALAADVGRLIGGDLRGIVVGGAQAERRLVEGGATAAHRGVGVTEGDVVHACRRLLPHLALSSPQAVRRRAGTRATGSRRGCMPPR